MEPNTLRPDMGVLGTAGVLAEQSGVRKFSDCGRVLGQGKRGRVGGVSRVIQGCQNSLWAETGNECGRVYSGRGVDGAW